MGSTSFMKKFHSFPILTVLQKESSTVNIINSKIYMLSEQTLEKIFKYFHYHDIVKVRCVCNWFYSVAGSILNKKFLSLSDVIDKKVSEVHIASKMNPKMYGYLKVLYIVKSEMKILQACCEDYILNNTFYFNGGTIIDIIESILKTCDTKKSSDLVTQLLMQIDKFLDNFDLLVEPFLLEKSVSLPQSWFGKKMIDILECSINANKNIELSPSVGMRQGHCILKGTYESRKVYSVKPPPSFLPNTKMTSSDMFLLMKYLRNHVRWNNTLNYQLQDDFEDSSQEDCVKELPNIIFRKRVHCNEIPFGSMRLIINFELYCLKIFAPMTYKCYLQNIYNSFDSKESVIFDENDYRLNLKLEIGYIESENYVSVAKLKTIKLKQKTEMHVVTCDTKMIKKE